MEKACGLWRSLELLTRPAAVLAEWRMLTGDEFARARVFLRPTNRLARTHPCPRQPACGDRHEVEDIADGLRFLAVSRSKVVECPALELAPHDLVVHELDATKLCESVRAAFKFDEASPEVLSTGARSHRVGVRGAARSPVFLSITTSEAMLLREVEELLAMAGTPLVLLTPGHVHCTARVEGVLRRNHCVSVPLSAALTLGERGRFSVKMPIDGVLAEFDRRLVERGSALVKTVEQLRDDMRAVAKGSYELRQENEELRRLAADGYLKFARTVDPVDFSCFIFILAYGDRAKAARVLNMKQRTFYERVDGWATRGSVYERMLALVKCRKESLSKGTVPLGASVQSGGTSEAENPETIQAVLDRVHGRNVAQRDYPDVLREILNALVEMNAKNWSAIRTELIEGIREEVPQ